MIMFQPNSPSEVFFIGYRSASVQLLVKGTLCLDVVTESQIYRFLIGSGWPENVPGKLVVAKGTPGKYQGLISDRQRDQQDSMGCLVYS